MQARLSFASYLKQPEVAIKFADNCRDFATGLASGRLTLEHANRLFNDFPSENDYFGNTHLSLDFIAANAHIQEGKVATFEVIHFIRKAFVFAIQDILDENGNIKPDLYELLSGVFPADTSNDNSLKWSLISGYITNIIFSSPLITKMLGEVAVNDHDDEAPSPYSLFMLTVHAYLHKIGSILTGNQIKFNDELIYHINTLFDRDANAIKLDQKGKEEVDHVQDKRNYLQSVYGEALLSIAREGESGIIELIEIILNDRRLINIAIEEYGLIHSDDNSSAFDKLLTGRVFDLIDKNNILRLQGLLVELYSDKTDQFQLRHLNNYFQQNVVANRQQTEGLVLGVVIHFAISLSLEATQPLMDDNADNELLLRNQALHNINSAVKASGPEKFTELLAAISNKYFSHDAESRFTNAYLTLSKLQPHNAQGTDSLKIILNHINGLLTSGVNRNKALYDNLESLCLASIEHFKHVYPHPNLESFYQQSSEHLERDHSNQAAATPQSNIDLSDWEVMNVKQGESNLPIKIKKDASSLATRLDAEIDAIKARHTYRLFGTGQAKVNQKESKRDLLSGIANAQTIEEARSFADQASANKKVNNARTAEVLTSVKLC